MRRRATAGDRLWRWLPLAAGLHAAAAAALLIEPRLFPAPPPAPAPEVLAQVELVQQDPQHFGAADPHPGGAGPAAPPPAPPTQDAAPDSTPPPAPEPTLPQDAEAAPPPVPTQNPASAPAPASKQPSVVSQKSAPTPEIRLGDDAPPEESTLGAYSFGDGVVAARPDAAVHNTPPAYPKDAARRREQGTVVLIIHIAPDGAVSGVDIQHSSGSASLDQAARAAVARWHFRPALQAGAAVASDFTMQVTFEL